MSPSAFLTRRTVWTSPPSSVPKKLLWSEASTRISPSTWTGFPQAGKTTTILSSTTTLGGKGANQSVGAAKLGREVSLIGEIGNDTDSTFIFDILEKEQVTTQGVHRDMKAQTGKAYIYIERDGEGTITIMSGANGNLSPNDIQKRQHLFENAGFCLLSTEIPIQSVLRQPKPQENTVPKTSSNPQL